MNADQQFTIDPRFGNKIPIPIRHDFKRACYRVFLAEFTAEDVKDFFSRIPLVQDGRKLRLRELLQLLWSKKAFIPLWWDAATDNILEEFLIKKGVDPAAFLRKILWLNNKSTYIPGKVLLTWFYPKLETLFGSLDTRDAGVYLITLFNENWTPKLIHRRIRRTEQEGMVESTMAFIPDPTFREFVDWDMDFIGGPQMLAAPAMIGLPPFEGFGMVADTRPPERVIWRPEDMPERSHGTMRIQGKPVGRETGFLEFCARRGLEVGNFDPPDIPVVEMFAEYRCPIRNRVVLHAGCAYGAPFFLHTLTHRKRAGVAQGAFTHLVSDMDREEKEETDALESRHLALLASLQERADFTYHVADESMSLNGEHLIKGISAKVLHRILSTLQSEGRSSFSYREFKRDEEISLGQKNVNFEVRFYRLSEKLRERTGAVSLVKTGRGAFRLDCEGEISLTKL